MKDYRRIVFHISSIFSDFVTMYWNNLVVDDFQNMVVYGKWVLANCVRDILCNLIQQFLYCDKLMLRNMKMDLNSCNSPAVLSYKLFTERQLVVSGSVGCRDSTDLLVQINPYKQL